MAEIVPTISGMSQASTEPSRPVSYYSNDAIVLATSGLVKFNDAVYVITPVAVASAFATVIS